LRSQHKHSSFLGYSGSALLHSAVYHNRPDKLEALSRSAGSAWIREELLLAYYLNLDFTAETLIKLSKQIRGINRRYLSKAPDKYTEALEEILKVRYREPVFPFASRYKLSSIQRTTQLMYANISFPDEIRSPEIPDFLNYEPFTEEVRDICAVAHESVKTRLKTERRRRKPGS